MFRTRRPNVCGVPARAVGPGGLFDISSMIFVIRLVEVSGFNVEVFEWVCGFCGDVEKQSDCGILGHVGNCGV